MSGVELLPLPEWTKRDDAGQGMVPSEIRLAMTTYARACVDHATAAKDAEIEALRAKTAVTMGAGTGDGDLFVHGDYESIKAAQEIVLERDALRAEVGRLQTKAAGAVDAARGYQRELAAEYARAERLAEVGRRVTTAFRAHGEASISESVRTRRECEDAMLALDASLEQEGK